MESQDKPGLEEMSDLSQQTVDDSYNVKMQFLKAQIEGTLKKDGRLASSELAFVGYK